MEKLKKTDFACLICNKILNDHIQLPCYCTICHKHLKDGSVKDGQIKCATCKKDFMVKDMEIRDGLSSQLSSLMFKTIIGLPNKKSLAQFSVS